MPTRPSSDETIGPWRSCRRPLVNLYLQCPARGQFYYRKGDGGVAEGILNTKSAISSTHRFDVYYGGPIGDWRASIGGFYRRNDGIRDPGYTFNQGGQFASPLVAIFQAAVDRFQLQAHRRTMFGFYLGIPLTFNSKGKPAACPVSILTTIPSTP